MDYINPYEWETILMAMLEEEEHNQIVFVNYSLFVKAIFNKTYKKLLNESALNIPVGKKISKIYKFVHKEKPETFVPFKTTITILGIMEKRLKSLYILGGRKKNTLISERNLKTSFPGIKFIGRFAGFFTPQTESDIITGIKKATPDFLLAGSGLKGKELWLHTHRDHFERGISLWGNNCFEIFSGKANKNLTLGTGLGIVLKNILQPWKVLLIFREIYIHLRIVIEKLKNN